MGKIRPVILVLSALIIACTLGCLPEPTNTESEGENEASLQAPPEHSKKKVQTSRHKRGSTLGDYQGGKIEFTELSFDFGEVIQGESVSHLFEFRNTGEELLKIGKVRGG